MRKVTVRSPTTDRLKLEIAEGVQDLSKTPAGTGTFGNEVIAQVTPTSLTLTSSTGNMDEGGSGMKVLTAGLYLLITAVVWNFDTVGGTILRRVGVIINDTTTHWVTARGTVGDCTDQAMALVRLAVGDTLRVRVEQDGGGNATEVDEAFIYAALVAP